MAPVPELLEDAPAAIDCALVTLAATARTACVSGSRPSQSLERGLMFTGPVPPLERCGTVTRAPASGCFRGRAFQGDVQVAARDLKYEPHQVLNSSSASGSKTQVRRIGVFVLLCARYCGCVEGHREPLKHQECGLAGVESADASRHRHLKEHLAIPEVANRCTRPSSTRAAANCAHRIGG